MNHLSDEELVAKYISGNSRAMNVLVVRYHGRLIDFAYRHLGSRETAADIAQTAFLRVVESARSFRARSSFRTWLYAVALNLIRDEARRRKLRGEAVFSDIESREMPDETDTETSAIERVDACDIWEKVDELSEDHRSAIILKFREQMTYDEIALVMGAPNGTVKSWVHYALKALRKSLGSVECEV